MPLFVFSSIYFLILLYLVTETRTQTWCGDSNREEMTIAPPLSLSQNAIRRLMWLLLKYFTKVSAKF